MKHVSDMQNNDRQDMVVIMQQECEHLEHVYPVEAFEHDMSEACFCEPEFLQDDDGFYFLHHRVSDKEREHV